MKNRLNGIGRVGIYKEGQSHYIGVVKIDGKEFKWYGWNRIPKCIKDVCCNAGNSNYANVTLTINEDGSYPKINGVMEYIQK